MSRGPGKGSFADTSKEAIEALFKEAGNDLTISLFGIFLTSSFGIWPVPSFSLNVPFE